ncbi:hypothetical protein EZS27_012997, partial [termite gut metagenome]
MIFFKFPYKLSISFLLFLWAFPIIADNVSGIPDNNTTSGLTLNNDRFFRFNNRIEISFDLSLKKGFDQYLEYVIRIYNLNRHTIDIVINLQEENPAELLIISGDRLSKRALKERKTAFLEKTVHFDFRFDLKGDQLSIIVGDFVFIENRLGLKPRTDYKILLGSGSVGSLNIKTVSALQIDNIRTYPDLISSRKKNTHNTLYWIL